YTPRLAELHAAYEPRGVAFAAINSNAHEGLVDLAGFARIHRTPFPVLKDRDARVADQLGVQRTPMVLVLDKDRQIRYRGRIDDQYTVAGHRQAPSRRDLAMALDEVLAGR